MAGQRRGTGGVSEHGHAFLVATTPPSAVLRADNREVAYTALVDDLRVVKREFDTR